MPPTIIAEAARHKLLSFLGHQPPDKRTGMIEVLEPASLSCIHRSPGAAATLGALDKLPLELIHYVFSSLGLRSLVNVKRTCLRGAVLVESLPEFRDLVRHAPDALAALGCTGLLQHHSARTLHHVLLSSQCVSCLGFGPYLFLPTCERCCHDCLQKNQSLWVMPLSEVRECFVLYSGSMRHLPVMRSQPGTYANGDRAFFYQAQYELVSVKAAKQLSLRVHRTDQAMKLHLYNRWQCHLTREEYEALKWLQAAPLEPIDQETLDSQVDRPTDEYCGMASISFPSLSRGARVADRGIWCLGCERVYTDWQYPEESTTDFDRWLSLFDLEESGVDVDTILRVKRDRAFLEKDFLEHIRDCSGARELMPDLEEKLALILQSC